MSASLIELQAVFKIYRMGEVQVAALDSISLQIQPGEFVAIMGPSGSGKSTLLNILGCLDRPTQGQYILDGEDVSQLSREQLAHIRNRKIGFIFQSYNLLAQSSALENVLLPIIYSRNGGHAKSKRLERARAVLKAVGLAEREKHKPAEMSGGEQQRVAIGRALINDPPLILADEPTGNLDTHSGQEIMQILDELHQRGRTIVMVTHEAEIAAHAQRTLHLRDGRIELIHVNGTGQPDKAQQESSQ
jgi:putative ABC transport system ATP-binding protein